MDYQDIKIKALKTVKDVKRTSENLYSSAKISVKISKKECEIDEKYIEIGKLIYDAHSGCETNGERVSHLCDEIDKLMNEISSLRYKQDMVRSGKKCDVCGCPVGNSDDFCPNCGCEL